MFAYMYELENILWSATAALNGINWMAQKEMQTEEIEEMIIYSWIERQTGGIDLNGFHVLFNALWQTNCDSWLTVYS